MKKLYFISLLILCVVVFATAQWKSFNGLEGKPVAASVRDDSPSGTVVEFTTAGYYSHTTEILGKTYSVLSIPKAVTFLEKGYPELPRISRSIVIPDDAKMKFEIVEAEYETTHVAPIGIDIGAVTAEEIAVSIVAKLVRVRRGGNQPLRSMSESMK